MPTENYADREQAAKKRVKSGGVGQGRIVCRLKGGWLLEAPSPDLPRPAKPCGDFSCHPGNANSPKSGGLE